MNPGRRGAPARQSIMSHAAPVYSWYCTSRPSVVSAARPGLAWPSAWSARRRVCDCERERASRTRFLHSLLPGRPITAPQQVPRARRPRPHRHTCSDDAVGDEHGSWCVAGNNLACAASRRAAVLIGEPPPAKERAEHGGRARPRPPIQACSRPFLSFGFWASRCRPEVSSMHGYIRRAETLLFVITGPWKAGVAASA
ncbi:hypothetical protein SEVIR_6G103201v4 [Setaria viridis]